MSQILTDYLINPRMSILLPAKQIEYDTIVLEQDRQLYVQKTAMQLIEKACLIYGSTYEGRKKAASYRTAFKRKIPIPISISRDIYTLPTHATTDYDCAWIFLNQVQFTQHVPSTDRDMKGRSMVVFNNNLEISLDISHHIIEKQIERASMCRYIFTHGIHY